MFFLVSGCNDTTRKSYSQEGTNWYDGYQLVTIAERQGTMKIEINQC